MIGLMLCFNLFTQLGLRLQPAARRAGAACRGRSGSRSGAALAGALARPEVRPAAPAGRAARRRGCGDGRALVDARADGGAVTTWDMAPATLVAGIGSGLVFAPMFDIILAGVERAGGRLGVRRAQRLPAVRRRDRRGGDRHGLLRAGAGPRVHRGDGDGHAWSRAACSLSSFGVRVPAPALRSFRAVVRSAQRPGRRARPHLMGQRVELRRARGSRRRWRPGPPAP